MSESLRHIAFIMDGNGRWAKKRLLPRSMGHRAGVKRIKEIILSCFEDYGIHTCSLYCFSTENWNRPEDEIRTLFRLLKQFFEEEIDFFKEKNVRIRVLGFLDDERIPEDTRKTIEKAVAETAGCDKYVFNVLFNYGSRQEILAAAKSLARKAKDGIVDPDKITLDDFRSELFTGQEDGDVDLLVRTSGEERLSNCLLYQVAYAEFIFTDVHWPDFDKKELAKCIDIYKHRNRRFGAIKE